METKINKLELKQIFEFKNSPISCDRNIYILKNSTFLNYNVIEFAFDKSKRNGVCHIITSNGDIPFSFNFNLDSNDNYIINIEKFVR
jgi:hypothetical protein